MLDDDKLLCDMLGKDFEITLKMEKALDYARRCAKAWKRAAKRWRRRKLEDVAGNAYALKRYALIWKDIRKIFAICEQQMIPDVGDYKQAYGYYEALTEIAALCEEWIERE